MIDWMDMELEYVPYWMSQDLFSNAIEAKFYDHFGRGDDGELNLKVNIIPNDGHSTFFAQCSAYIENGMGLRGTADPILECAFRGVCREYDSAPAALSAVSAAFKHAIDMLNDPSQAMEVIGADAGDVFCRNSSREACRAPRNAGNETVHAQENCSGYAKAKLDYVGPQPWTPLPRFEFVSYADAYQVNAGLPMRKTQRAAGYDFAAPMDIIIPPHEMVTFRTGIKAHMPNEIMLMLFVRSSIGIGRRIVLANGTGIIDADYADNEDNEGNITAALQNMSDTTQIIHAGERYMQGVFVPFVAIPGDNPTSVRSGGIGSTDK